MSIVFRADRVLHNKEFVMRNILFKFKAIFSLEDNGLSVHSDNSTEWKSACSDVEWIFSWSVCHVCMLFRKRKLYNAASHSCSFNQSHIASSKH